MFVSVPVEATMAALLGQEDTDGDLRITVEDHGPRRFLLKSIDGSAFLVAGTYALSNLLQELALARERGEPIARLRPAHLFEPPVKRISRLIRVRYWEGLTRRMDAEGLSRALEDPKMAGGGPNRLYVPAGDELAWNYYRAIAQEHPNLRLEVRRLPEKITPEIQQQLNREPGLLALALRKTAGGDVEALPFVVPGGRFNELYGWDSYFEALGLIRDGLVELARNMVEHFIYEIHHYGKILNANRTYYLTRSQPPLLTSMIRAVFDNLPPDERQRAWLERALKAAIQEYSTVWMGPDRLTPTGLSRYFDAGQGMPPETEPEHFDPILRPYAEKAGLSLPDFRRAILEREIVLPELEEFFLHDRAMRESGHDTSNRLINRCAHLNTVDLNALLFRYEMDLAELIQQYFDGEMAAAPGETGKASFWRAQAEKRKATMNALMWDEARGLFFDYDFVRRERWEYESATTFYPLWAGLATERQAERLVKQALPLFEAAGGIVASTAESRGPVTPERPQRQWDYPFGWAPHQMLVWEGLRRYNFVEEASRLAYRWLYMITRNAMDYHGTIPEKYDVVNRTHQVFAEYGNVGTEFSYITREGFGWMNASFQVGQDVLTAAHQRALRQVLPPEWKVGPAPCS
ncbi:MAG: trehalase [Calditrichaeota bacterium]|nr:MAG: trehalase [Calditrichota bacterium]